MLWWRGPAGRPVTVPLLGGRPHSSELPIFLFHRVERVGGVGTADELQAFLGPERVGATLAATIIRGGVVQELRVTVAAREEMPG